MLNEEWEIKSRGETGGIKTKLSILSGMMFFSWKIYARQSSIHAGGDRGSAAGL